MFRHDYDGFVLRGEFEKNERGRRVLWIPGEDIAKVTQQQRLHVPHLKRLGLEDGIDFRILDRREPMGSLSDLIRPTRGNPRRLLLAESGMYQVIMAGRGKESVRLRRWLSREVIPSIREYGEYNLPDDHPIIAILQETSAMAKNYRDLYLQHTDQTLADLIGQDISTPDSK